MDKITMSSLMEKMTASDDDKPLRFDAQQAEMMIGVLVDRLLTGPMAGLGYKVSLTPDDAGWTIRIDR